MNSNQWLKVKDLFGASAELSKEDRERFLNMECLDSTVKAEVWRLLTQYDAAGSFLDGPPDSDRSTAFAEGEIVGNRYRIVRRLGTGGMGEVYEVTDMELSEQIALKTVRVQTADLDSAHLRLTQEAQLARRIAHPNVCRVFDIGRHGPDGKILFMTMELIEGETLAARLNREKVFSPERTVDLVGQIAEGVAAAHAVGIVHRDLKPANVILASDGRVVVTDFGLARRAKAEKTGGITKAGQVVGTLPYMAPEQVAGGNATISTDVYALAVMVNEMLTGRRPSDGPARPAVAALPESMRPSIDRAMHADPNRRTQSITEFVRELQTELVRPRPVSFRKPLLIGLVFAMALLAFVMRLMLDRGTEDPSRSAPVVLIGDLDNRTGNSAFDLTASSLLHVAMGQSRYLNVLSRVRLSEALSRARMAPWEQIKSSIALKLANSEGAKYAIEAEIVRRAETQNIVLRVIDVETARTAKSVQASLAGAAELPVVMRQLSTELRLWMGEPSAQVSVTNLPLAQVTTKSAAAWERFSRASQMAAQGRFEDEISLLKSAVEIDSEFAMAYDALGLRQNMSGNIPEGLANVSRAYSLRSRATEREAYIISGHYHTLRYELGQATEAFRTLTNLYPYDDLGHRFFAQALSNQLLAAESIKAGRTAVSLNPKSLINIGTLAGSFIQAGEYDEALALIDNPQLEELTRSRLAQLRGLAWLGKGDFRRADEEFNEILRHGQQSETLQLSSVSILEGRVNEAISGLESSLTRRPSNGETRLSLQRRSWLLWLYNLENRPGLARAHVQTILDQPAVPSNLRELRAAAIALFDIGEFQLASRVLDKAEALSRAYGGDYCFAALAHLRAESARAKGDQAGARKHFDEAIRLWPDALTLWSAARFAEESGETERAGTLYQDVLARRGEIIIMHFPGILPLAQLGHGRAESKLLHFTEALKDYDDFLATFGRFSPELDLVKRAMLERSRIIAARDQ